MGLAVDRLILLSKVFVPGYPRANPNGTISQVEGYWRKTESRKVDLIESGAIVVLKDKLYRVKGKALTSKHGESITPSTKLHTDLLVQNLATGKVKHLSVKRTAKLDVVKGR